MEYGFNQKTKGQEKKEHKLRYDFVECEFLNDRHIETARSVKVVAEFLKRFVSHHGHLAPVGGLSFFYPIQKTKRLDIIGR